MSRPDRNVRCATIVACLVLACLPVRAGDRAKDRKGTFARVLEPSTIVVTRFNHEYYFQLLGVKPYIGLEPSDPLEKEAREFLTNLLAGRRLVLTLDDTAPQPDERATSAGYLFLEDGTFVNAEVLTRGYGRVEDDVRFARRDELEGCEEEARGRRVGLWEKEEIPSNLSCSDLTIGHPGFCGVTHARLIQASRVEPDYPWKTRRKGIEGRVALKAVIDAEGRPQDIQPMRSPHPDLTQAAIAAVEQWRFSPGLFEGRPIAVYQTIVVDFVIPRRP